MKRTNKGFLCLVVGSMMFIGTTGNVFAANQKFIDQVKTEYTTYESKASLEYENYQQSTTKEFEQYQKDELNSFGLFANQTKQDTQKLDQELSKDIESLKERFGGNSSYGTKLRDYENKINPNYLGSPMQQYVNSTNPNYLNSLMMQYKNAVNQNYLDSPMMKYKNAVYENYLNSPMMQYKNAVNENYLNSPMSKLKNGSNEHFLNSIMNQYSRGKMGQQEASNQWRALFQKESQAIQTMKSQSTASIQQIKNASEDAILKQKYETVNGILQQRAQTLQTINEIRTDYFGEGLSFEALIPDLGKINVIIDEEWLGFKQPPTLMNGTTLVPMRAIFEKLGAEVKWNQANQSITASKGNVNISLTINKNKAAINGETITLSAAPRLINGSTMVPLRFVSESLGADVKWDGQNKTVFIHSK